MQNDSVDDMYENCVKKMAERVQVEYFPNEIKNNVFATVWKNAEKCMKKSIAIRPQQDSALTDNHLRAICAYTAGGKYNFYKDFNNAVLTRARVYKSNFPYHAMHFWLTTAIQILRTNNQTCHYTYRRTKDNLSGNIGQKIRFGTFTSTSFRADMTRFGAATCFYIKTCFGAYLKDYPTLNSTEQEVLVPPYEVFKIVKKGKGSNENLEDCSQVYVLENAGHQSNLSCQVATSGAYV